MKNGKLVGTTVTYVLIWGIGLFCTTFFSAVAKWDLMQIFEDDIVGGVLAPSIVVFALFLWEEAAGIENANLPPRYMKELLKWNFIIIGITLIMLAITGLTDGILQLAFLIIGWMGITAIKFISKYYSDLQIEINKI